MIDQAAVVVAPHRWEEPFGRSALEAGARSRPLVTSDLGGIRETTTAETAIRVPPGDPAALATAIAALLKHPARARRIGRAARTYVEHRYTPRSIAQQHMNLYTHLLGASRS
jgi:glycosyltransferase involved in cell wall biosynthesis